MNHNQEGRIHTFFHAYEKAIQPDSGADLGEYYHQSFLFAGTEGAQPVKIDDFIRVVPKMSADAKARGVSSTTLESVEVSPLDGRYTLAKVTWDITFREEGEPDLHIDAKATYVLMTVEDGYRIVAQIDHQDLSQVS